MPLVWCALDVPDARRARALARTLSGLPVGLKVGLELVYATGPAFVRELAADRPVLLDAKLHDIPQTVARAAVAIARLGATAVTAHALGGGEMLARARTSLAAAAAEAGLRPPLLLAVTILTSHSEEDLARLGWDRAPADAAVHLARLAVEAGADGVVCAPTEVAAVRAAVGAGPLLVTPGVRPAAVAGDDQRRTATPAAAIAAGADSLVVGRPVTAAPDPRAAAQAVLAAARAAAGGETA